MTLFGKIKWILGVLVVFMLILATNLIDRDNFTRLNNSVATIYEDRLIAKGLIFEMSTLFQEKELAIARSDSAFFGGRNEKINGDIQDYIDRFAQTKLTVQESKEFDDFQVNFAALKESESTYVQSGFREETQVVEAITEVRENLHDLSQIQLAEGRRQVGLSQRAIDTVNLFTQIEIFILAFLAIVIQAIVIYKPKE